MSNHSVLMRWWVESIEDDGNRPLYKLMIHMMQPCPVHSYSRDPQHDHCYGHDTIYQLGDCSSIGMWCGVMVGLIYFNVD